LRPGNAVIRNVPKNNQMPNETITTSERAMEYTEGYLAQIARQAEDEVDKNIRDWLNDDRGIFKVTGQGIDEAVLLKWIKEAVRKAIT